MKLKHFTDPQAVLAYITGELLATPAGRSRACACMADDCGWCGPVSNARDAADE